MTLENLTFSEKFIFMLENQYSQNPHSSLTSNMYTLFGDFYFCGYTDHPMTPDWPFLPNLENVRFSALHLQSLETSRSVFYEQIKYSIMTLEE